MALRHAASGASVLVLMAIFCGCGGPKVDEKKPLAEIRTEAQKMTSRELRRVADAYGKAVVKKREAVDDLRDRLEDLEPEELTNQGAATLKKDADDVATSIQALDERQKLYVDLLYTKVDEDKPITQIEAEIAVMPVAQIGEAAKAYRDTIVKNRDEVTELTARLDEMKPEERSGSEAAKITKKIKVLTKSDEALCERLNTYVKSFGSKGGDVSGLSLP